MCLCNCNSDTHTSRTQTKPRLDRGEKNWFLQKIKTGEREKKKRKEKLCSPTRDTKATVFTENTSVGPESGSEP